MTRIEERILRNKKNGKKRQSRVTPNENLFGCVSTVAGTSEVEPLVSSQKTERFAEMSLVRARYHSLGNQLDGCRIVALDWHPNSAAGSSSEFASGTSGVGVSPHEGVDNGQCDGDWDGDCDGDCDGDWGGLYGKCCGHNEIVMQYCRPFAPMEVANTRVCSRAKPAPGNEGYDGCLEFLCCQCRWFGRALSIWDTENFHYIDAQGKHTALSKDQLLGWSVPKLQVYLDNMRYITVECNGSKSPWDVIDTIDMLLKLGCGQYSIMASANTNRACSSNTTSVLHSSKLVPANKNLFQLLGSFLLIGTSFRFMQIMEEI